VSCMGMVSNLLNILNRFVKAYSQMTPLLFDFCHAGLVDEGLCCYTSLITVYTISAKLEC
jgi:hypothetical protein